MIDISSRLRAAREAAGFERASDATDRFGWTYSTYAGHENGARGIKNEALRKYARAFGVSLTWLMTGTGPMTNSPTPFQMVTPPETRLSEPDATEFIAKTDRQRADIAKIAALICPNTRNPIIYSLNRDYPGLFLMRGDLLIIDQHTDAKVGQITLTRAANSNTGTGHTRLRIKASNSLMAPYGSPSVTPEEIDEAEYGTVVATIRTADLRL